MSARIQSAPGERGCCDAAGRLVQLAYIPRAREELERLALARGEGTPAEIRARIDDLLAAGLLIECEG